MIVCGRCGERLSDDRIYDATPCPRCGNLITAYMTLPDGRRVSEAEYLRITASEDGEP